MRKTKNQTSVNVRTTTISVTKPATFAALELEFRLVRYVLPDRLRKERDNKMFQRVHAKIREQIDHPYKSYKYDKMDGAERWAVYVLYPKSVSPQAIIVEGVTLEPHRVSPEQMELHVLLKLLQVLYFQGGEQGKFTGRDACFIYARRDGKSAHICMEIEITGDPANKNGQQTQRFRINGSAHKFLVPKHPIQEGRQYQNTYFSVSRMADDGLVFFRQVKPNQVVPLSKRGQVYEERTFEGRRTTLDYYSVNEVERSRGYLLDTFITGFTDFLAKYGFSVEQVKRQFTEFEPKLDVTRFRLPIEMLDTICIYDMRLAKDIPIEDYRVLFLSQFPDLKFEVLPQLTSEPTGPLLFIMDYEQAAFEEGMPLQGQDDPYQQLYEQYPHLPKQGLNINPNELKPAEDYGSAEKVYLDYEFLDADDKRITNAIAVSINQLFLKDLIICSRAVDGRLPITNIPFAFVRKMTQQKVVYEVALYFEEGIAQFLDLRDPQQRTSFYRRLQLWGVDWEGNYQAMTRNHGKKEGDDQLTRYDLILGPGFFVEIADLNERILYEFDEITERQAKRRDSFPITDFKLSDRYDDVKTGTMLSQAELVKHGLVDTEGNIIQSGKTKKEMQSLELFVQLRHFDSLLDEMGLQHPEISFQELCNDEHWLPRIAQVFGKQPDEQGKFQSRFLKDFYKRIDMFPSDREGELTPTYQGIWHDADRRFIIGDVYSLKLTGQARAHLVRQFVPYQGAEHFDLQAMLDATSVKFVRLKQFTVYPYYFHLIGLYIENVLQHNMQSHERG